jgi:hypothetical protein
MHLISFIHVWITAFVGLVVFGAAGLSATNFLPAKKLSILAAPLAGICLWTLTTLAIYVGTPGLGAGFDVAAQAALVVLLLLSLLFAWINGINLRSVCLGLAVAAIACLVIAPIMMAASIDRGEHAVLYVDGADHFGYSHLADWMRSHAPQTGSFGKIGPAVADRTQPYSAWPYLELTTEPRAGASAYLALVAILLGQSATSFSYDAAAAIALAAACLGCAAVFVRSWKWVLCLAPALLTCVWYDYGHLGFFGKLLSYPIALFSFGMFLSFRRPDPGPAEALVLSLVASGAALMHNGQGYALMFTSLALPFLAAKGVIERRFPPLADLALAALPPFAAIVTSGTLSRPLTIPVPDYGTHWESIPYLLADLNGLIRDVSGASPFVLLALLLAFLAIWAALVALAAKRRDPATLALLCGPAVLAFSLSVLGQRTPIVQLSGFLYPAALCAAFMLLEQQRETGHLGLMASPVLLVASVAALLLIHVPRSIASTVRYTIDADRRQMLTVSDFDLLQSAIGEREVYVDMRNNIQKILPVMVELGRRDVKLVWSPDSWNIAASFLGWPALKTEIIPALRLIDATDNPTGGETVLVETRRYKLVGPPRLAPPATYK